MKTKTKMLLVTWGLLLPYVGFICYYVLTYRQRPFQFPSWFPYVAPCYFIGSIALLVRLRKKIESDTPSEYSDRGSLKWLWFGVALYALIFLNGLRLGLSNAGEVPLVAIVAGECVNGAILTALILTLRKVHKRVQQTRLLASDRDRS